MIENTENQSTLICRSCLSERGEMKNMYEWGLDVDFFRYTDISKEPSEGLPVLLCLDCEADLKKTKDFIERCRRSNQILKQNLKMLSNDEAKSNRNHVSSLLMKNKLILMINAPNVEEKINLPCPFDCDNEFTKKIFLSNHLIKTHNLPKNFGIELQFYCSIEGCIYVLNSKPKKFFSGRKYLNQHINKIHKEKIYFCDKCKMKYSLQSDLDRHSRTCNVIYTCPVCKKDYNSNETYLVHLKRRHPNVHAKFKLNKKLSNCNLKSNDNTNNISLKRKTINIDNNKDIKRTTINKAVEISSKSQRPRSILKPELSNLASTVQHLEKYKNIIGFNDHNIDLDNNMSEEVIVEENINEDPTNSIKEKCLIKNGNSNRMVDAQSLTSWFVEEYVIKEYEENTNNFKKTSATQMPETISDETIHSWTNKTDFKMQTDGIATQTVLDEILSLKPQNNEDESFFPESVSDIETQTFPFEFPLNRCNKETQFSNSLATDLSFKETQTCFCFCPNSRSNCRHFGCPISSHNCYNVISTETQTGDSRRLINSDVMLSCSSAETQTCFEDSNDM